MKKTIKWSPEFKDYLGLPRPFAQISQYYQKNKPLGSKTKSSFYLHETVPIPWQSAPIFSDGRQLGIILENEDRVYLEDLCAYCGIKINNDEQCVRWTFDDVVPRKESTRIFSDTHPFHEKCMKQARVYCPYMREREDEEFQYGRYDILKNNAIQFLKSKGVEI